MESRSLQVELELDEDFKGFSGDPEELILLLQFFQNKHGYLSEDTIAQIAAHLKCSEAHVFGVASFFAQFRFTKPGNIKIRVCQGTACHVQGGQQLSDEIRDQLGILPGHTTPDFQYEFEEVACLGCCAQAPVVEKSGKIHGKLTRESIKTILNEHN